LKKACEELLAEHPYNSSNRFIKMTMLDYALADGKKEEALKILGELKTVDRLRENYYQWRINGLK
jgi:hypothetical protein